MMRAVRRSTEFARVRDLPRRSYGERESAELASYVTDMLRRDVGTMALFPQQAIALKEAFENRGALVPLGVGKGKTLISLLLPRVLECSRPLLILPAKHVQKTQRALRELGRHFLLPRFLKIVSYEILGRVSGAQILDQYQPDLIIWSVTLESLAEKNAVQSPMIQPGDLLRLSARLGFSYSVANSQSSILLSFSDTRRTLSDWYRLQMYGFMWAATGIDQDYPLNPTPAQRDLEADTNFGGCPVEDYPCVQTLYEVLKEGIQTADGIPVWVVNEPMLVSSGLNSDVRYNFYYPRWVYDLYRSDMAGMAKESGWTYLDLWCLAPENEFTNSAIHLTPAGEQLLAERIAAEIESSLRP